MVFSWRLMRSIPEPASEAADPPTWLRESCDADVNFLVVDERLDPVSTSFCSQGILSMSVW
jgi:hypothetical protein